MVKLVLSIIATSRRLKSVYSQVFAGLIHLIKFDFSILPSTVRHTTAHTSMYLLKSQTIDMETSTLTLGSVGQCKIGIPPSLKNDTKLQETAPLMLRRMLISLVTFLIGYPLFFLQNTRSLSVSVTILTRLVSLILREKSMRELFNYLSSSTNSAARILFDVCQHTLCTDTSLSSKELVGLIYLRYLSVCESLRVSQSMRRDLNTPEMTSPMPKTSSVEAGTDASQ